MRVVWLNYDESRIYVTTSQSRVEGQGNTYTDVGTYIQTDIIGQTGRPTVIETTHLIGMVFSQRKIQTEF